MKSKYLLAFNSISTLITKWENEVIEFKLAGADCKTDKVGEYFSALAIGFLGE